MRARPAYSLAALSAALSPPVAIPSYKKGPSDLPVRAGNLKPHMTNSVCTQYGKADGRNGETVSEWMEVRVNAQILPTRRPGHRGYCRSVQQ